MAACCNFVLKCPTYLRCSGVRDADGDVDAANKTRSRKGWCNLSTFSYSVGKHFLTCELR